MLKNLRVVFLTLFFITSVSSVIAQDLQQEKKRWLSTGADNSLDSDRSLFRFKKNISTSSEETNIHSHYRPLRSLRNYTFSGQMRINHSNGGIGVTFQSKYNKTDRYYRLRSYPGDPSFQIAPHPDGIQLITDGDIDSEVAPSPGTWYNFKILVRTSKNRTRIRAKVWEARTAQPGWLIDCTDSSEEHIKSGKVGLWSMGTDKKLWRRLKVRKL